MRCGRRGQRLRALVPKISRLDAFLVPGAMLCAVGIIGTSAKFSAPLGTEVAPRRSGNAGLPEPLSHGGKS